MNKPLESIENDPEIAHAMAHAANPNMVRVSTYSRLAAKISLDHIREKQEVKARWHEERAMQEAEEARELMLSGLKTAADRKRFKELTDPNREPYVAKPGEFPPEALISDKRPGA